MKLISVEPSRVIHLFQRHRPAGQLFLPRAAAKLIERYSFTKPPKNVDELTGEVVTFSVSEFDGIAIEELNFYPDGIIVRSRSHTEQIMSFIKDLLTWSETEFGLVDLEHVPRATYYESSLVFRAEGDILSALKPAREAAAAVQRRVSSYGHDAAAYEPSALVFDTDPTNLNKRKPNRFSLERRVGVPFDQHVFFSTSPLTTVDHLQLLEELERLLLSPRESTHLGA